jgi:hypothetical protein
MYEAPNEVFTDKSLAKTELEKREIESFRGVNLSSYIGEDPEDYILNGDVSGFFKYVKDEFNMDISDDFYFDVPNDATDKQIKGLMKLLTLRFHTLKEITINE